MELQLALEPRTKNIFEQEIQQSTKNNPRNISFNLNTKLTDLRGDRDIGIHEAAALKAQRASEDLTANNPGLSASTLAQMKTVLEAAVKYIAVASAGSEIIRREPAMQRRFEEALERRKAIEQAQKAAMSQAIAQATKDKIQIKQGQKVSMPQGQEIANSISQPQAVESVQDITQPLATAINGLHWQSTPILPDPMGSLAIDMYRRELSTSV